MGMTLFRKECVLASPQITAAFQPSIINATFYQNCIEDSEEVNFNLTMAFDSPCHNRTAFEYTVAAGDKLYVLQNGSLLVVYEEPESGYDIFSRYCLDVDMKTQTIFALQCEGDIVKEYRSSLGKFYKGVAVIMILSFVGLIITGTLYIIVPRFRSLHGRSLVCHLFNLSMGYLLTSINYFKGVEENRNSEIHFIHYFISAAFMWQLVMVVDTCINVWYYLPKQISPVEGRHRGWIHFLIYFLFSQLVPILFTLHGESDNDVSYLLSTLSDDNHDDQWYFFGPILFIIVLCFALFVVVYFGFRELNEIHSLAYIVRMQLKRRNIEEPSVNLCSKEMQYVKSS